MRKFFADHQIFPAPSGRISIVSRKPLESGFKRLLKDGFGKNEFFLDGSSFQTVRDCWKDESCLEDGTELEALMQLNMYNLIRQNTVRTFRLPLNVLIFHEPVSFRPTNLLSSEFEAYDVTREMYNEVTERYQGWELIMDPTDSILIAYSNGMFSGIPLNRKATNQ